MSAGNQVWCPPEAVPTSPKGCLWLEVECNWCEVKFDLLFYVLKLLLILGADQNKRDHTHDDMFCWWQDWYCWTCSKWISPCSWTKWAQITSFLERQFPLCYWVYIIIDFWESIVLEQERQLQVEISFIAWNGLWKKALSTGIYDQYYIVHVHSGCGENNILILSWFKTCFDECRVCTP